MAPLNRAINIRPINPKESQSNTRNYEGVVDREWTVERSGLSSFSHRLHLTKSSTTVLPTEVFFYNSILLVRFCVKRTLGYLLALILEACIQFQSTTAHIDPIHVTAHYLRASFAAPFTICIRSLKTGSGFTNLSAELLQEVLINIQILIFKYHSPSQDCSFVRLPQHRESSK